MESDLNNNNNNKVSNEAPKSPWLNAWHDPLAGLFY
jgi:hypothetical protein